MPLKHSRSLTKGSTSYLHFTNWDFKYLGYDVEAYRLTFREASGEKTFPHVKDSVHWKVRKPRGGYVDFTSKVAARQYIRAQARGKSIHPAHKMSRVRQ